MTLKRKPTVKAATRAWGGTASRQPEHYELAHGAKCSCGCVLPTGAWFIDEWWTELEMLAARFANTGITGDLAAMCLCQCWGAYLFLLKQG